MGFVAAVLLTQFVQLHQVAQAVRQDTLRLHVLANSDSLPDQLLKLKVRDAVLAQAQEMFAGADDREQAISIARNNLHRLRLTAQHAVAEAGSSQTVRVSLEQCGFPVTGYRQFTLPGGSYPALRVELGQAAGHNWFCVLYPAICLAESAPTYPTDEENSLVLGNCRLRLAVLDWLEGQSG